MHNFLLLPVISFLIFFRVTTVAATTSCATTVTVTATEYSSTKTETLTVTTLVGTAPAQTIWSTVYRCSPSSSLASEPWATPSSSIGTVTSVKQSSSFITTAPSSTLPTQASSVSSVIASSSAPVALDWPPIPNECPIQYIQIATFDRVASPYTFEDPSALGSRDLIATSDPQNSWDIISPGYMSKYAFVAYNRRSSTSPYSGTTLTTKIDTCPGVQYKISVNIKFLDLRRATYVNIFVDGQYVISKHADGTAVSDGTVPASQPGWLYSTGTFTATGWSSELIISFLCTSGETETFYFDNLVVKPMVEALY